MPKTRTKNKKPGISKLDNSILQAIFANVVADGLPALDIIMNSPLRNIRGASQVCKKWRRVLLQSPQVWAKCIELDNFALKSDYWRNLVLERTGQSLLKVTGIFVTVTPGSGLFKFIINLLTNHWWRIEQLILYMSFSLADDIRIWESFCRPARNLTKFVVSSHNLDERLTAGWLSKFQLFANDAPSLVHLRVRTKFKISENIAAISLLTRNLKVLALSHSLDLRDRDLLTALNNMPLLEDLTLHIHRLITSPSGRLVPLRPHVLPRLRAIYICCAPPDIYSALLEHITPAPDCKLQVDHDLLKSTWTVEDNLGSMKRVLKRFGSSLFRHYDFESLLAAPEIELFVSNTGLTFDCCSGVFCVSFKHPSAKMEAIITIRILDIVSTFRYPPAINALKYSACTQMDVLSISSGLLKLFKSLPSITRLTSGPLEIGTIRAISGWQERIFPYLETVKIPLNESLISSYVLKSCILPFLQDRYDNGPVKVKVLQLDSPYPGMDFTYLEELFGLEIRLSREDKHVCGSVYREFPEL